MNSSFASKRMADFGCANKLGVMPFYSTIRPFTACRPLLCCLLGCSQVDTTKPTAKNLRGWLGTAKCAGKKDNCNGGKHPCSPNSRLVTACEFASHRCCRRSRWHRLSGNAYGQNLPNDMSPGQNDLLAEQYINKLGYPQPLLET